MPIPNNFNPHIILNIMAVLFSTQESLAITTSIYFWYEYCNMFDAEVNSYFLNILVKFYFFKLGLNWSKSVREGFFYFICFRVVFMYELGVGNATFDNLFLTINQYLNITRIAADIYGQKMFSIERLPRKERRKVMLSSVKEGVIAQLESLDRRALDQNFFTGVPKFMQAFNMSQVNPNIPNDYFASKGHMALPEEAPPVVEADEEDITDYKNSNTVRFLRSTGFTPENIKLAHISKDEVQYAAVGLTEFRTQLSNFQRLKAEHPGITLDLLPKLKMKLPIDEFEFIEEGDAEW